MKKIYLKNNKKQKKVMRKARDRNYMEIKLRRHKEKEVLKQEVQLFNNFHTQRGNRSSNSAAVIEKCKINTVRGSRIRIQFSAGRPARACCVFPRLCKQGSPPLIFRE